MYKRVKNIKNEKLFYIGDIAAVLLVLAVIIAALVTFLKPAGKTVEIYVGGELAYSFDLSVDREVVIDKEGHNVVEIKDGKVTMRESDCKGQTCVHEAAISKTGDQIVCLPNKVIVVITDGKDGGELDART